MTLSDRSAAISIGAIAAVAYLAAGFGLVTDYDYYGRLADAFLHGRWWLEVAPPWLNELLPCGDGRFCVVYPPLPAILVLPLAPFLSTAEAQVIVSRIAGGASAGVLYYALRAYGAPRPYALAGTVLSAFGTTLFFSSVDGRAWYAAHSASMLFLAGAFALAARGGPPVPTGVLVGLSALARLPVAAAAPALALLAARRGGTSYRRALTGVLLGGLPLAIVYVGYNVLRWGTPLDEGYARLTQDDVFFNYGLFSPIYLVRHLVAIFLEAPDIVEGTPFFLRPRFVGMSLFLTTPAFLWVFVALREIRRDVAVAATAAAALLALLPDVLHGTVGFQQFGYRFSIDAQPFLVALAISGDGLRRGVWRRWPSVLFIVAVLLSLAVNIYATIAITRYGYWQ
ncbi:MAG TPA: hypothetical protein VGR87_08570 [Candidatus Limnocylindria bacterium]|jgi:hypothetical protein|nr:hypothetical protein [Candidatus Limnocylindria bacterium]